MIRNLAILGLLMVWTLGYTWYDDYSRQSPAQVPTPKTDILLQQAPDFAFETLDGQKHRLSDFKGKAVVLNFWASWCAPCVIEFPQMLQLAVKLQNEAVFVFASQDDDRAPVERFLKKYGQTLPQKNIFVSIDKDKHIAQDIYQTFKLPETYLIAPDGTIAEKIIGADVEWNGDAMRKKLDGLR